jgi:hypothetical protein
VAEGRGYIFAALFQGLAGPASAALCKGACHEEYVAALKAAEAEGVTPEGGEAVRRAVSAVFTALEARLAAATDMVSMLRVDTVMEGHRHHDDVSSQLPTAAY